MRIYQVRTFVADQTTEGRLEHRRWASNQGAPVRRVGVTGPYRLRSLLELSLERVVTGVWVEYHWGPTRRQPAGYSRAPGRRLDVVRRSAWCPNQS